MLPLIRGGALFDRLFGLAPDSEDGMMTIQAAALLDVKEFAFFRLAYRWWFGENATDDTLEPLFMRFLKSRTAPAWVRHFAREIIGLHQSGQLDRTVYGLPKPSRISPTLVRIEAWFRTAYIVVWIVAGGAIFVGIVI